MCLVGDSGHCAKEFSVGLEAVKSVVFSSRDPCWCLVTSFTDGAGRRDWETFTGRVPRRRGVEAAGGGQRCLLRESGDLELKRL